VKIISCVKSIAADVFKNGTVKFVAARFCHDADLTAGSRSEFRRKIARIHAKLLYVLKARLKPERRRNFTVQIAGRSIDDRRAFDAVISDDVLLIGAARKSNVGKRSGAAVNAARR